MMSNKMLSQSQASYFQAGFSAQPHNQSFLLTDKKIKQLQAEFHTQKQKEKIQFMNFLLGKLEKTPEDIKNFVNAATDKNGNVPDQLECLICNYTIYDPRRCMNEDCDQFYCRICLEK